MSLTAFLVTAFLEGLSPAPRMLACTFPGTEPDHDPIHIRVEAMPSLKDRIDSFRIKMHLDEVALRGTAQPIDRTDARDVLIGAKTGRREVYAIGLRDDGRAALNLLQIEREEAMKRRETRAGTCHDFEGFLDTWLAS